MVFTIQRMSTIQSGTWKHNPLPSAHKTEEAVKNGTKRYSIIILQAPLAQLAGAPHL
jgi:hypothetical protein